MQGRLLLRSHFVSGAHHGSRPASPAHDRRTCQRRASLAQAPSLLALPMADADLKKAVDDCKEEAGRPSQQQHSRDGFHDPNQPPCPGQQNIAVAGSGIACGGEVKTRFPTGQPMPPKIDARPKAHLDPMQREDHAKQQKEGGQIAPDENSPPGLATAGSASKATRAVPRRESARSGRPERSQGTWI